MKYVEYFLLFLLSVVPAVAQAQDGYLSDVQARYSGQSTDEIIKDGLRLYSEGRTNPAKFEEAIDVFEYARSLDPDQTILYYNIARSYHLLGSCEKALNEYLIYQSVAAGSEDYSDVSGYIDALSKQCGDQGTVVLTCSHADAVVSFDGERKEVCDGIHRIKAGSHRLAASKQGYFDYNTNINIDVDQLVEINIDLTKDKNANSGEQVIYEPESLARPLWISGVVTTSLGTAAIIAGSIVVSLDYAKDNNTNKKNDLGDDGSSMISTEMLTGAVLWGIGGTSLITGIILLIVDAAKTDTREEQKLQHYHDSLSISPSISITDSGAAAAVNFTF